jgi:hypothetical protein
LPVKKKLFLIILLLSAVFSFNLLFATPQNLQLHIIEMGDVEGGCAYCHNQTTKISRQEGFKQGYKKGQVNYNKIGTFSGCNSCHTKNGSEIKK